MASPEGISDAAGTSLDNPVTTAGLLNVCFREAAGSFVQQLNARVAFVDAAADSVTAVSPLVIGAGSTVVVALQGAVATPSSSFAFSTLSSCASPLATTPLTASNAAMMLSDGMCGVCVYLEGRGSVRLHVRSE